MKIINNMSLRVKRSNLLSKRAAMFGLDARIALAVVAAISVLTAANIYRTLGDIQVKKIAAELKTVGAAIDEYHKDMNSSIFNTLDDSLTTAEKEVAAYTALYKNENLKAAYSSRWNGPYIKNIYDSNTIDVLGADLKLSQLSASLSATCNDSNSNPCYVFAKLEGVTPLEYCDIFEELQTSQNFTSINVTSTSTDCDVLLNVAIDY